MKALMIILGVISTIVVSSILNGWVLSLLWGWYFVPIFGLPELGIASAIGISIVVHYLTENDSSKEDRTFGASVIITTSRPLIAMLMGYIVLQFV